ncbi:hypothetical protein PSA5_17770 [Pseudomonas syringae pv. actinidiae]|nr:hypothetical protein PSA5_17770 [Pseudomonas syringae pv. actinidiae]
MMQARGRLIGLGVGPGDPELITVKALRLLRESPVVAYFVAKGKKGNAFGIIEAHLQDVQTLMPLVYPVTTEHCQRRCRTRKSSVTSTTRPAFKWLRTWMPGAMWR